MRNFGYSNFKVTVDGKDITEGVTIAEVYLDITNPCWSAKVSLLDSVDLINTLPMKKNAKVMITIETSNKFLQKESKDFNFVLYKIGDKVHFTQHSIGYTLYLAMEPMLKNITKRFSRSLVGEPSQLIADMFGEVFSGYTCTTDGSNGQVNFMSSANSAFNTFGQLLKSCHKNNVADYLLVQTSNTEFAVKSIADMYDDTVDIKFKYLPAAVGESLHYPYLINKYEVEHYDGALNLASGFYGNNVSTYDYTNKKWTNKTYTNTEDKQKLSDGEDYTEDTSAHAIFQPMHHNIMDDGDSELNDYNTWLPSRRSSIFKLEQEKLLIQTSGNMEFADLLGKSIMVEIPKQDYFDRSQMDPKRSGRHLVTAIGFILNKQMFVANLELVKREFEG